MFKTPIPTNEDNRKGNNSDAIYKRSWRNASGQVESNLHAVWGIPVDMKWLRAGRLCAEQHGLQADEEGKS